VDIRQIGQDLNVRYVVRGSIQRLGEMLKVNAELGSTETGAQLWSDNFDQQIADLAAGQEQIVVRMRVALNISLADIEAARSLRERPTNPDAFDLILRALAISWLPQTKETVAQALRLYEQALERDPNSVSALVGASYTVGTLYYYDAMPYNEAMDRAVHYLARARALAPNSESVLVQQSATAAPRSTMTPTRVRSSGCYATYSSKPRLGDQCRGTREDAEYEPTPPLRLRNGPPGASGIVMAPKGAGRPRREPARSPKGRREGRGDPVFPTTVNDLTTSIACLPIVYGSSGGGRASKAWPLPRAGRANLRALGWQDDTDYRRRMTADACGSTLRLEASRWENTRERGGRRSAAGGHPGG
jgi:hypothetical protein